MLDIGWTELLVIAVVLIVVVGPKDLPPMLRAFGKMTANLRKMAGDFRTQFDQALREADMDDLRQTITDAQRFHPANALREAINPLREMGNEIRNDLQKATTLPAAGTATGTDAEAGSVEQLLPTSDLSLPETPPASLAATPAPNAAAAPAQPASGTATTAAPSAPAAPAPSTAPAQSAPASVSAPAEVVAVKKPRAPRKPKAPAVTEPVATAKPATRRPRAAKSAADEPATETVAAAKPAPRPRKKPATPKDNA